jgi:hypothetical protein
MPSRKQGLADLGVSGRLTCHVVEVFEIDNVMDIVHARPMCRMRPEFDRAPLAAEVNELVPIVSPFPFDQDVGAGERPQRRDDHDYP